MKTTMTANDFIQMMEESDFNRCNRICQMFIDQCRASNPHMTHMSGSDWLSMLINDYNVVVIEDGKQMSILLEPKQ
jgi:hypothetical protein